MPLSPEPEMKGYDMENQFGKSDTNVSTIGKDTRADMHSAIDKAHDKVPAAADRLAAQAHMGVDKMADSINDMGEKLDQKRESLTVAYKRFAESGRTYVRKSPATSVLVALAAGYAVSKLFGTRKY
jgi:ElaB protein